MCPEAEAVRDFLLSSENKHAEMPQLCDAVAAPRGVCPNNAGTSAANRAGSRKALGKNAGRRFWLLCFPGIQPPQGYGDLAGCPMPSHWEQAVCRGLHSLAGQRRTKLPAPAGQTDLNGTDGHPNRCTPRAGSLALLITHWIYPCTSPPNKLLCTHLVQVSLIPPCLSAYCFGFPREPHGLLAAHGVTQWGSKQLQS